MPQREVAYPRFVSRKRKSKRAVAEGWVRRSSGEWRRRWVTDRAWRRRWPPWMWMLSLPCEIGHPKTDCEKIPFGSCTPCPCLYHHLSFSICIYLEQFSFLLFCSLCFNCRDFSLVPTQPLFEFFLSTIFWDTDSAKWRVDELSLLIGPFPILKIHVWRVMHSLSSPSFFVILGWGSSGQVTHILFNCLLNTDTFKFTNNYLLADWLKKISPLKDVNPPTKPTNPLGALSLPSHSHTCTWRTINKSKFGSRTAVRGIKWLWREFL